MIGSLHGLVDGYIICYFDKAVIKLSIISTDVWQNPGPHNKKHLWKQVLMWVHSAVKLEAKKQLSTQII